MQDRSVSLLRFLSDFCSDTDGFSLSEEKHSFVFIISPQWKPFHLYGCLRLSVLLGVGNVNPTLSRPKLVSNHGLKNKSMLVESWRAGQLVKRLPALDDWLQRMSTGKVPCTVNNWAIYLWHIFVLCVTANKQEAWVSSDNGADHIRVWTILMFHEG